MKFCHAFTILLCYAGIPSVSLGQPDHVLAPVTVIGQKALGFDGEFGHLLGQGAVDEMRPNPAKPLEESLQSVGWGSGSTAGSLGVSTGLNSRGFSVKSLSGVRGKILLNGHPDMSYAFARDSATIENARWVGGLDSTFVGAASPGGLLMLQSKQPQGIQATSLGLSLSDSAMRPRFDLDTQTGTGALQGRAVLYHQRGPEIVPGLLSGKYGGLLVGKWLGPAGTWRVESELANSRHPFEFGTVYAAGRIQWDRVFVSDQSTAQRTHKRHALYWEKPLGENTELRAWWQRARVSRDEFLAGFWTVETDQELSSYLRKIDARATQADVGALWQTNWNWGSARNQTKLQYSQHHQTQDFAGPQSIAAFLIDIGNPTWPSNLQTQVQSQPPVYRLSPRYFREDYRERGVSLANLQKIGQFEWRVGLRRSGLDLATSSAAVGNLTTRAAQHANTLSVGGTWAIAPAHKLWLSRNESFDHQSGLQKSGDFLPPTKAHQWEAGWRWQQTGSSASVAAFQIRQSNVAATDPTDRNYLVPVSKVNSSGLNAMANGKQGQWYWRANVTAQSVRAIDGAGVSERVLGQPSSFGGFQLGFAGAQGFSAWANPFFSSKRLIDSSAGLYAPGFTRWDIGVSQRYDNLRLQLGVLNVLNKRYLQAGDATDNLWQGPRRRVQLSASLDFQ